MRTFRNPFAKSIYDAFVGRTPKEISDRKIYGGCLNAFSRGYEGYERPLWVSYNTAVYYAYLAGKDTHDANSGMINAWKDDDDNMRTLSDA